MMQCQSPKAFLKQIPLATGWGHLAQLLLWSPADVQYQPVKAPLMGNTFSDGSIPLDVAKPKLSDC
jgi:hypothetical protein